MVFAKDGEVFANSRDVAEFFGKRHDAVLRDIRSLVAKEPDLGLHSFVEGSYTLYLSTVLDDYPLRRRRWQMAMLQNWVEQARAHWKEFQPAKYRQLKQAGKLEPALQQAANQTSLEMGQMQDAGIAHQDAWEQVRERYLFPPDESPD